ncbi:MAG TPA: hypothetical protein VGI46_14615 [Candidatus Acidoferrum sp.]
MPFTRESRGTPRAGASPSSSEDGSSHFCHYHAQKESRAATADKLAKDLAAFFSGHYVSANDVSSAVARLIPAVVRGDIKPRTVAYLAQTLLQSIHLAQSEFKDAFGQDALRKSVRCGITSNHDRLFPPEPQAERAPEQPAPPPSKPEPAQPRALAATPCPTPAPTQAASPCAPAPPPQPTPSPIDSPANVTQTPTQPPPPSNPSPTAPPARPQRPPSPHKDPYETRYDADRYHFPEKAF